MNVDYVLVTENEDGEIIYHVFFVNGDYKAYENPQDMPIRIWRFLENFENPTDVLYLENNCVWQIQSYGKFFDSTKEEK